MFLFLPVKIFSVLFLSSNFAKPLCLNHECRLCLFPVVFAIEDAASNECVFVPNFLDRFVQGVDITKLDLSPMGRLYATPPLGTIMDFTCKKGKRVTTSGLRHLDYQLPDQFMSFTDVPSIATQDEQPLINIFTSASDIKQQLAAKLGVQYQNGMFSRSSSIQYQIEQSLNKSQKVATAEMLIPLSNVLLPDPDWFIWLGGYAVRLARRLPKTFESDYRGYYAKFTLFGTHFFIKGQFGILKKHFLTVANEYVLKHGSHNLHSDISKFFNQQSSVDFHKAERSKSFVYGGNAILFGTDPNLSEVVKNAFEEPWFLGGQLMPIYNFLDDEKSEAMKKAVDEHLAKAFLEETDNYIKAGLDLNKNWTRGENLTSAVEVLKRDSKLTEDKISKVYDEATWNFVAPDWWKNTSICFEYSPDNSSNRCENESSSCALIDEFTSEFKNLAQDDGEYLMRWAIKPPSEAETWFTEVQICYKVSDEGNNSTSVLCAPAGTFTAFHSLETDSGSDKCSVS